MRERRLVLALALLAIASQPPASAQALSVSVSLDPAALTLEAGGSADIHVTLRNEGLAPVSVDLEATSRELRARVEGNATQLMPGGSARIIVLIEAARAGPGDHAVLFEATDERTGTALGNATLAVAIPPSRVQEEPREEDPPTQDAAPAADAPLPQTTPTLRPTPWDLVALGAGALLAGTWALHRRWPILLTLYSRLVPARILDSPARRRICDVIAQNPGLSTRELQRNLGMANGVFEHHLHILRDRGHVVLIPFGREHGAYLADMPRPPARPPLDERILTHLRQEGPATAATLARHLGIARQLAHYHLRRLAQRGAIERAQDGWRAQGGRGSDQVVGGRRND